MSENEQSKKAKVEKTIGDAFCIDGKCKEIGISIVAINGRKLKSLTFELTDSKKGIFYVTLSQT